MKLGKIIWIGLYATKPTTVNSLGIRNGSDAKNKIKRENQSETFDIFTLTKTIEKDLKAAEVHPFEEEKDIINPDFKEDDDIGFGEEMSDGKHFPEVGVIEGVENHDNVSDDEAEEEIENEPFDINGFTLGIENYITDNVFVETHVFDVDDDDDESKNIADQIGYCPRVRYVQWSELPEEFKWITLAYNLKLICFTWDYKFPTNHIESTGWYAKDIEEKKILRRMGYTEDVFDCCLNHYNDYSWEDFTTDYNGNGVEYQEQIDALEALGYNQKSWDNGTPVAADMLEWEELSEEQRELASSKLCYTGLLWNQVTLPEWGDNAVYPDAY